MSVLRNCRSVGLKAGVGGAAALLARLTTPMMRSSTRTGRHMKAPEPYLGSRVRAKRGSVAMSSTSTGSPSCTTLPAMLSPTGTSAWSMASSGRPRATTSRRTCRSWSSSMIEPMEARTVRIVRSRTRARRSCNWGMREASSTTSFSVLSLKTRSSSRSVEARRSLSMWVRASPI